MHKPSSVKLFFGRLDGGRPGHHEPRRDLCMAHSGLELKKYEDMCCILSADGRVPGCGAAWTWCTDSTEPLDAPLSSRRAGTAHTATPKCPTISAGGSVAAPQRPLPTCECEPMERPSRFDVTRNPAEARPASRRLASPSLPPPHPALIDQPPPVCLQLRRPITRRHPFLCMHQAFTSSSVCHQPRARPASPRLEVGTWIWIPIWDHPLDPLPSAALTGFSLAGARASSLSRHHTSRLSQQACPARPETLSRGPEPWIPPSSAP